MIATVILFKQFTSVAKIGSGVGSAGAGWVELTGASSSGGFLGRHTRQRCEAGRRSRLHAECGHRGGPFRSGRRGGLRRVRDGRAQGRLVFRHMELHPQGGGRRGGRADGHPVAVGGFRTERGAVGGHADDRPGALYGAARPVATPHHTPTLMPGFNVPCASSHRPAGFWD